MNRLKMSLIFSCLISAPYLFAIAKADTVDFTDWFLQDRTSSSLSPSNHTFNPSMEFQTRKLFLSEPISEKLATFLHQGMKGTLSLSPDKRSLIFTFENRYQNQFSDSVSEGNARKVALAIDEVFASGSSALNGVVSSLTALGSDPVTLGNALDQLQPALFRAATLIQENNVFSVRNALTKRMEVVVDLQHCFLRKGKEAEGKSELLCFSVKRPTHIWGTGIGDFLHQKNTSFYDSPQVGYYGNTGGFVGGVDYNFAKYFYAGALGAYTHSFLYWNKHRGQGDIDSGYAGLYLSAMSEPFYTNLAVVGGWNSYSAQRKIIFTGVHETAKNQHRGKQLASHLDAGFNIGVRGFTVSPFDSFDFIVQQEDPFKEKGAGEYNLSIHKSHANLLRNELGFNLASCTCFLSFKAALDMKFSWVREVRMSGKSLQSTFQGTDIPFVTIGYFPNRNLFSFGTNMTFVALKDKLSCTIYYNGVFAHNYADNGLGGQLSYGF